MAPADATRRILGGRRPRVLDGFTLLNAAGRTLPGDATQADVSGRGLVDAVPQDLSFFTALERLDASDNAIPLSALARLPSLVDLSLDCNSLAGVRLPPVPVPGPGPGPGSDPGPGPDPGSDPGPGPGPGALSAIERGPRTSLPFCSLQRLSLAFNAL